MSFAVELTTRARENLKALRKRDQQIVYDAVAVQLIDQPDQPTRNRK
jgi:mRNA-degrading endonuclease RelE of RelBE toxin-antitoxin system